MITRLALIALLLSGCDTARSLSINGKTVSLGASAAVADCPKCPACSASSEPADTVVPVAAMPPQPPVAAGVNWWVFTTADTTDANPMRGLWPGGGAIPVSEPGWRCTHSAPSRGTYPKSSSHSEVVESVVLDCNRGAARVRNTAICAIRKGVYDRAALFLGADAQVAVSCRVL